MIQEIAKRKWFVPLVLFILLIIGVTSFADKNESKAEDLTASTNKQVEDLCNSVPGVSDAKVMITYTSVPAGTFKKNQIENFSIRGIAVVCKGGDDPNVQLTLHELLETLFQLSSTQITISERK